MGTFGTNRRRGQSRAMHIVLIFLLSAASASGSSIRVMSYNLYGWNAMGQEAWKKPNLWKTIRASQPDVLGVQEVDGGFNGDAIIYRTSVLTLQNYGKEGIDEQDQWGKRWIGYANFIHNSGKQIDFFNTHFCVCSAGDLQLGKKFRCCDGWWHMTGISNASGKHYRCSSLQP